MARLVHARFNGEFIDGAVWPWLQEQVGRGLGAEIGARIARCLQDARIDAPEIARGLAGIDGRTTACIAGAANVLVDLAASAAPTAAQAASLLHGASRPSGEDDTLEDRLFHESWVQEPAGDPELDEALARHYGRLVDVAAEAGHVETQLLAELHVRIQRYPAIVAAITPGLLLLLHEDVQGRPEVLRLLCHARCDDPRVRESWLEAARGWTDFAADALGAFPCLARHDLETSNVLTDVMRRADQVWPFGDKLAFAGELDADRSSLARHYLDNLGGDSDDWAADSWAWVASKGFRGLVFEPTSMPDDIRAPQVPSKARAVRMNRLALNCATRKYRGLSFAEDEAAIVAMLDLDYNIGGAGGYHDYVQWGFFHAQTLGLHSEPLVRSALGQLENIFPNGSGWSTHADAALAFLESAELTIAQQVALERALPYSEPGYRIRGVNIVNTRYDGRSAGNVALARSPAIRGALYSGNTWALDELERITRLIDRDVDYLLAVLASGTAESREWALGLIDDEKLEAPHVRDAVRLRLADVDSSVRRRAQGLVDQHGW